MQHKDEPDPKSCSHDLLNFSLRWNTPPERDWQRLYSIWRKSVFLVIYLQAESEEIKNNAKVKTLSLSRLYLKLGQFV